ncbi:hypothetical protein BPOR_0464g00010 [Botrytis porri]|uniref:Uncharacterized protein n=1 Tax=Botrytis porri TaxID=87229 RepID=A0A4Z1KHF7_9HELO|nr:hypothetical protein BPOR_0464g00010 [Botrytis porri]
MIQMGLGTTGLGEYLAESQVDIMAIYSTQYIRAHSDIPDMEDHEPIDRFTSYGASFRVVKEIDYLK